MTIRNATIVGLLIPLLGTSIAQAQEATERYIPIGQSPGLSHHYTYYGTIEAVNSSEKTITVRGTEDTRTLAIDDSTRIWLDRSALGESNLTGSISDLQVGQRVEMKYQDYARKERASWIKVAEEGGS